MERSFQIKRSKSLGKIILAFSLILFLSIDLDAQDSTKTRNWTLNGYVKNMLSYSIAPSQAPAGVDVLNGSDDNWSDLIHNRLNFKWYPHQNIKLVAEMRNRIFFDSQFDDEYVFKGLGGDSLSYRKDFFIPGLDASEDYLDLSYSYDAEDLVFHTVMDRLYFQYNKGNFEGKIGRQRINWGINTVWNPNDIFNAYSYFDFDYEERPGSDALVLKYYTGIASSIELAGKFADSVETFTSALLWKVNKWNYDLQFLGGVSGANAVLGAGWAGNIKKAGFKGECSYFIPFTKIVDSSKYIPPRGWSDTSEVFSSSISIDYSFKSSLYIMASLLYSSNGKVNPNNLELSTYYNGNISAKFLSPYRYSTFLQLMYQFHPLVNGGIGVIAYPGSTDLFVGPMLTISLLQSLDMDFFAQILLSEVNESYQTTAQLYFWRLKYSF